MASTKPQLPEDATLAVLRMACAEIRRGQYTGRYLMGEWQGQPCLFLKRGDVLAHLKCSRAMKGQWRHYRTFTIRQLKQGCLRHRLLLTDAVERQIAGQRVGHLLALDLAVLARYGIHL